MEVIKDKKFLFIQRAHKPHTRLHTKSKVSDFNSLSNRVPHPSSKKSGWLADIAFMTVD